MSRLRNSLGRPSLVLFACLFASQSALLVLSPILPDLAHVFDVSTATAGQLRTLSGATGGVTAIVLAVLPRRPRIATLLSAGAALVSMGAALSAAALGFAVLAAAQGVIGVGIGLLVAVGIAAAFEWSEPHERPRTLAWTIAGMPAAWVLGMPVAGEAASIDWRVAWLALPAVTGVIALALVRLAPQAQARTAPSRRTGRAPWRRREVARFIAAELLANAAWAGVLTYAGTLLIEGDGASRGVVSAGLALSAAAMVPGTFVGRRSVMRAGVRTLSALTIFQGGMVLALGTVRPGAAASLALLAVMAFVNGWRSVIASGLGMDSAPDDRVAVMSMRAAANQFGYLLGAAAGGLTLAAGGFAALGTAYSALFAGGALLHVAGRMRPSSHSPGLGVGLRLMTELADERRIAPAPAAWAPACTSASNARPPSARATSGRAGAPRPATAASCSEIPARPQRRYHVALPGHAGRARRGRASRRVRPTPTTGTRPPALTPCPCRTTAARRSDARRARVATACRPRLTRSATVSPSRRGTRRQTEGRSSPRPANARASRIMAWRGRCVGGRSRARCRARRGSAPSSRTVGSSHGGSPSGAPGPRRVARCS